METSTEGSKTENWEKKAHQRLLPSRQHPLLEDLKPCGVFAPLDKEDLRSLLWVYSPSAAGWWVWGVTSNRTRGTSEAVKLIRWDWTDLWTAIKSWGLSRGLRMEQRGGMENEGKRGWGWGGVRRKKTTQPSGFKEKRWHCEKTAKPSWFWSKNEESPSSCRAKRSKPTLPNCPFPNDCCDLGEAFPQTTTKKVAFKLCYIINYCYSVVLLIHVGEREEITPVFFWSSYYRVFLCVGYLKVEMLALQAWKGAGPEMWVRIWIPFAVKRVLNRHGFTVRFTQRETLSLTRLLQKEMRGKRFLNDAFIVFAMRGVEMVQL